MFQSFIPVSDDSDFPITNLPYGIFSVPGSSIPPRVGVAIGDFVLDLALLEREGFFSGTSCRDQEVFQQPALNGFMALGREAWSEVRTILLRLLGTDAPDLRDNHALRASALIPRQKVRMHLPARIGDYTDFYSSKYHARNVGRMFRGEQNALMPNYLHLPVAYHGRSSSIVLGGESIHRPHGQILNPDTGIPEYRASRLLDIELEMGFLIGPGNAMGSPVKMEDAENHIFGFVLVNDWSARDVQKWEYQPLGPFNAKNFATSISPWVVTMDALQPFVIPAEEQDPKPLEYLHSSNHWTLDIDLEVALKSKDMNEFHVIINSNYKHLYWTPSQQLVHHTSTGCNLRPGDLLASGTISGPEKSSRGCLLELTWRGEEPVELPNGETRKFLADGDAVRITGRCESEGIRLGFGELETLILPAIQE